MRHVLDMLDLVEAEVQARQVHELGQALDTGDQVVVQIEVCEHLGETGETVDGLDRILAETEFLDEDGFPVSELIFS